MIARLPLPKPGTRIRDVYDCAISWPSAPAEEIAEELGRPAARIRCDLSRLRARALIPSVHDRVAARIAGRLREPCPTCGAKAGDQCLSPRGVVYYDFVHDTRKGREGA